MDFTKKGLPTNLLAVRQNCLALDDLTPSMELGDLLRARSIQGLVFRSAVSRSKNLVIYLENCLPDALEIHNASELMKKMQQILKPRPTASIGCVNLLPLWNEIDTRFSAMSLSNEAQRVRSPGASVEPRECPQRADKV